MKKPVALFLLILFSFNSVGFYLVFGIQLYNLKAGVEREIAAGSFNYQLLTITSNSKNATEFHWKNSREFKYQGKIYDVVETVQIDASTTNYVCKKDSEESDLFDALEKQLQKNSKRDKRGQKTGKSLHKVFFKNIAINIPRNTLKIEVSKMSFSGSILYNAPGISISSPPPQLV